MYEHSTLCVSSLLMDMWVAICAVFKNTDACTHFISSTSESLGMGQAFFFNSTDDSNTLLVNNHCVFHPCNINADPEIVFDKNYWYEELEVTHDQTCRKLDQTGVMVTSFEQRKKTAFL